MAQIKNISKEKLSDQHFTLEEVSFDYLDRHGEWSHVKREVFDRGNGACILLFNAHQKTVILVKQFRVPAYLNGHENGFLLEVCAGQLDEDSPVACIKREILEETGYQVDEVHHVTTMYVSPGAVTEKLYCYVGQYKEADRINQGGGLESENEDIEVLEIPFEQAYKMIETGDIQDAKTILLLQYAKIHHLLDER